MKIAYFSCQMPYPPTHGGLVDDWRRLKALKAAGARIVLITWYAQRGGALPPTPEHVAALHEVAEAVHVLPIGGSMPERLNRLWNLVRWPSHATSRVPPRPVIQQIWRTLDAFAPDVVWLDAIYPTVMARRAAKRYGVPLFYRSHNIEHQYMAAQVARTRNWRDRIAWGLNLPHLERVERATWRAAHTVFDISVDDLVTWREQGHGNAQWLPTMVEPEAAARLSAPYNTPPAYEVGYLGNLYAPNNVEGVLWFLREVVPLLHAQKPGLRILLAGSRPVQDIKDAVLQTPNVTLVENAPSADEILRNAQVLVNPVFASSGVNIKSVEMLFTPAQLVSTPQGVVGLPQHVRQCFMLASSASEFADAVLRGLDQAASIRTPAQEEALNLARQAFGFSQAQTVLDVMRAALPKQTSARQP